MTCPHQNIGKTLLLGLVLCAFGSLPCPKKLLAQDSVPGSLPEPISRDSRDQERVELAESRLVPTGVDLWWHEPILLPLGIGPRALAISADDATAESLEFSPEVQIIRVEPQIRRTDITRQKAAFDWTNFLETSWANRSDPIGSVLTTGSTTGRFIDDQLNGGLGVRKRSTTGAEWEISQRSGWQRNNSDFLVPNPQSTSRLELTVTQPLLAGRGKEVNYFRVVEAQLGTAATEAESLARLQDHVLSVGTSYWQLYKTRAAFLIRRRAVEEADKLVVSLTERSKLDATSRQILRAKVAAAQRRAELMTIAAAADTAETRLQRFIGQVDFETELVPAQLPTRVPPSWDRETVVQTALTGRPEIVKAVREVRAASLRLGVSRNQLLPRLDLLAGTYVAGLNAHRNLFPAYGRQFVDGRPSVNVGLVWERAVGNRAARGLVQRNELELQRSISEYDAALQTTRADVELALSLMEVNYQTMLQRELSAKAARAELWYLEDRWQTMAVADGSAILLLENLIDAQVRVADEETSLSAAEADLNIVILQYHRAVGTLLRSAHFTQSPSGDLHDSDDQTRADLATPMLDSQMLEENAF
ncbi:Outer membrane efflux protein [Roseimaritima multifibrata]|uniref:Outer membrane efflux protein n=1 Tax=Roseimaritima multifibrata TaxID=1930274 RepID=A0A517MP16_9BACT|nr:TolC family protein [Roseimaritima multifibrata]QDS96626.1 Outer membrane efflux protein [Roseimaritima multifibrata]